MKTKKTTILIIIAVSVLSILISYPHRVFAASDLDDSIGSYTDENISSDDKLGGEGINVKYTILNAKSKAKVEEKAAIKNGTTSLSGSGKKGGNTSSIDSVNMGAGSTVKGPIIIIDEGKGPKTAVSGN